MISEGAQQGVAALKLSYMSGMWEAPQVPNPKTDPEMAPIYRAQDDSPQYSSSQVGFGT